MRRGQRGSPAVSGTVPLFRQRQRQGQRDAVAEPWWHFVRSHPCAEKRPALLRRGSCCGGEGDRAGGWEVRRGRAQRAPVLLSDMILLMAIGNGFAALAGRILSFLPAFLPPPHGWARRRDAGRRLPSLFAGSASSTARASTAPDGGRDPTRCTSRAPRCAARPLPSPGVTGAARSRSPSLAPFQMGKLRPGAAQ